MTTVTQFIWTECLGMDPFEPPEPKGKRDKYGQNAFCWLCGGNTHGIGWHLKDIVGAAFTNGNDAKRVDSETICQQCAALMKKEAWEQSSIKFGYSPFFPVTTGKKPFLSNWMFSSHVFAKGFWARPDRSEVRDQLLSPPEPPFVMSFAAVGKKHILYSTAINHSRDFFLVNLDEKKIIVDRVKYTELLEVFERAYTDGFSKDSLLTGEYNQAAVLKCGLRKWREIEKVMAAWRRCDHDLLELVSYSAQKTDPS